MNNCARIGDAGVRRDARAGFQNRKKRRRRLSGHAVLRGSRQRRRRFGAAVAHRIITRAIFPQETGAPIERTVEWGPFILRRALVEADIGPQRFITCVQQGERFAAYLWRSGFEVGKPGKQIPVEKLIGGQEGIMDACTFVAIKLSPPQHVINTGAKAVATTVDGHTIGQFPVKRIRILRVVIVQETKTARDGVLDGRRRCIDILTQLNNRAPMARSVGHVALPFE